MPEYIVDKNGTKKLKQSFTRIPKHIRNTFKQVTEEGESIQKSMIANGYSKNSAQKVAVTQTKAWSVLLEQYLPDESLAQAHNAVLIQSKDLTNKMRAVDLAYKLKKRYDDTPDRDITVNIIFGSA